MAPFRLSVAGIVGLAIGLFAVTPLPAEEPVAMRDAAYYVKRYGEFLAQMQECGFRYSGTSTRSTAGEGLAGRWENSGALRLSTARRSLHSTHAATLTFNAREPKENQTAEYLGTRERLATPSLSLDVSEVTGSVGKYFVETPSTIRAEEWSETLGYLEFGALLGHVEFGDDQHSLLAIRQSADTAQLQKEQLDSAKLVGFTARSDVVELRVLFDPADDRIPVQVQVSALTKPTGAGERVRSTVTIADVQFVESKPVSFRLKIALDYSGGVVERHQRRPGESKTIELEPGVWEYDYQISELRFQEGANEDWFVLDHPIPNASSVRIDGNYEPLRVWENGKVVAFVEPLLVWPEANEDRAPADPENTTPLDERLARLLADVKVSGMHALVVLNGSEIAPEINDVHPEMFTYLPMVVTAQAIEANATDLAELEWPLPKAKEIVLVVVDGQAKVLGTHRLNTENVQAAVPAAEFLKRNAPPTRDARARLAAAREEARKTDRKVWLVLSGPRCGPCFRLARWMEQQHALLEKDYVVLKVLGGLDERIENVVPKEMRPLDGIPWFAITDDQGKILISSSSSPAGNIGMPSSAEGIQHLRKMLDETAERLSEPERKALADSLTEFK